MEFDQLLNMAHDMSKKLNKSVCVQVSGWSYNHSDETETKYSVYIADGESAEFLNPKLLLTYMENIVNPSTEGITLEDD